MHMLQLPIAKFLSNVEGSSDAYVPAANRQVLIECLCRGLSSSAQSPPVHLDRHHRNAVTMALSGTDVLVGVPTFLRAPPTPSQQLAKPR